MSSSSCTPVLPASSVVRYVPLPTVRGHGLEAEPRAAEEMLLWGILDSSAVSVNTAHMICQDSPADSPALSAAELRVLAEAIEIQDCGLPLCALPKDVFSFQTPHPYESVGAPYEGANPFALRSAVSDRLVNAQRTLASRNPDLQLHIWDGYRPLAVQIFMIEHTQCELAKGKGLDFGTLSQSQRDALREEALQIWAPPNLDPKHPPPHSTGGAVDLTIKNIRSGQLLPMGSEIDAMPPYCYPNFYSGRAEPQAKLFQENRELLRSVLEAQGFHQLPYEWWHFSYGDQRWAVLERQRGRTGAIAIFGRID